MPTELFFNGRWHKIRFRPVPPSGWHKRRTGMRLGRDNCRTEEKNRMKFIQLTQQANGELIVLNVHQIEYILGGPGGDTNIYLKSGRVIPVSEDPHEVSNVLAALVGLNAVA